MPLCNMMQSRNFWVRVMSTTIGFILVVLAFFDHFFFESWLIALPVMLCLWGSFLTVAIVGIVRQRIYYFKLFIFVALGVLAGNLYDPEWFKSPKILEAELK